MSAARQLTIRTAVSADARRMAEEALGGSYIVLPNGVDLDLFAKADPMPTDAPGRAVPRPPRAAQGPRRAARRVGRARPRRGALGRERRARDRGAARPAHAERRVARSHHRRREGRAPARRRRSSARPALGQESFGIVLLEAMAAGTAVLASDIPGYRNVARPDQEALLVAAGRSRGAARRAPPAARRRRPAQRARRRGRARVRRVLAGPARRALPPGLRDRHRGRAPEPTQWTRTSWRSRSRRGSTTPSRRTSAPSEARVKVGDAPGGDATLAIDEVAETVVEERLDAEGDIALLLRGPRAGAVRRRRARSS